jgi:hypothetical protein
VKLSIKQYFKAERDDLAAVYRKIRSDNPAMARLLYARFNAASTALVAQNKRTNDELVPLCLLDKCL